MIAITRLRPSTSSRCLRSRRGLPAVPDDGPDYLASLRAIPWVFSWTPNRVLLPAWFGCGAELAEIGDDSAPRSLRAPCLSSAR